MGEFRQKGEAELAGLDESELIGYALAARDAGEGEAASEALKFFAFGMQDRLLGFVRNQLNSHSDSVVEEVAGRALEDAIRSIETLRGGSVGEARAFVFKIARLRIVDYHRKRRIETKSLEVEPDPQLDGEADGVELSIVVEEALAVLRKDHRLVIELFLLTGCDAREAADQVNGRLDGQLDDPMSAQNVHQIASRFRKDLRRRLEGTPRTAER